MAEPSVFLMPKCVECGQMWLPWSTDRWQASWVGNGPEDVLLFFCAECAEREFGANA